MNCLPIHLFIYLFILYYAEMALNYPETLSASDILSSHEIVVLFGFFF